MSNEPRKLGRIGLKSSRLLTMNLPNAVKSWWLTATLLAECKVDVIHSDRLGEE